MKIDIFDAIDNVDTETINIIETMAYSKMAGFGY